MKREVTIERQDILDSIPGNDFNDKESVTGIFAVGFTLHLQHRSQAKILLRTQELCLHLLYLS